MKESRHGGSSEYIYGTKYSDGMLGQFVFTNMPPEAEQAIDDRVVTPTQNEFLRLAGIEIDGLPPLTIAQLIGPTQPSDLDRKDQAFYFSGPNHPILVKARKLPTFVTYDDFLRVHGDLGIRRDTATKNFKGLVRNLFEDEEVATYGDPGKYRFERTDQGHVPLLHRFAVRRKMAQMAMTGDYQAGISTISHDANTFNGYGRALIRAIYDKNETVRRMELSMQLESMPDLIVDREDARCFHWRKTYRDQEGTGYNLNAHGYLGPIYEYIENVLIEIGAVDPAARRSLLATTISESAFVATVDALCSLDKSHTDTIKKGNSCTQGVHSKGLTTKSVQRAKSIAACISESVEKSFLQEDEEINMLDPDLLVSKVTPKSTITTEDFQW